MKKRLLCLLLPIFLSLSALFLLPQNTYADPVTNPDTTITDPSDTETPAEGTEDEEGTTEEDNDEATTCYDQVGSLGWIICPSTGFLSNLIDGAYNIIQQLLTVSPISTDQNSPIHLVWEYLRNITNIVFIILLLVVVFSQVTGFGINNYNIRRILPRVIITAILINLSYIACALAVDISNVLGASLRGAFTGIQEVAIANGTVNPVANFSISETIAALIGLSAAGTGAVIAGVALSGGVVGLLWLIIPIIISGAVAIITALITLAARQALIYLLIMIAPIAIVAYLLPNTEKWFEKWKNLLLQMLIFYPMFSVLFGASQLAGWVIITSATSPIHIVLGIAVQILPLALTFPLMRMSKTILGRVNDFARRPFAPLQKSAAGFSTSQHELARRKYLANNPRKYQLSNRLARSLDQRRIRREEDIAKYAAANKLAGQAFAASSIYNRKGKLTGRGVKLYDLQDKELAAQNAIKKIAADLDEGYDTSRVGADSRIRNSRQFRALSKTNSSLISNVDTSHILDSRIESVKAANLESYAKRIETARQDQNSAIYRQIAQSFDSVTDPHQKELGINNVLANAIAMKAKVDSDTKGNYNQLFMNTAYTKDIHARLKKAMVEGNYNEMEAALENMALRGDFNLISDTLKEFATADNMDITMQKHLADTLIKYKNDSAPLWAYAKSLNVRRGKHAAGKQIAEFASYIDFIKGEAVDGDSAEEAAKVSMITLLKEISDPGVAKGQDRTTFEYILDMQRADLISPKDLGFQIKQLRSAASSGTMDGEQLGNLNKLITGGFTDRSKMKPREIRYFDQHKDQIRQNIIDYLDGISASQLAGMKESTFNALNAALNDINPAAATGNGVNQELIDTLHNTISTISRPSAASMRGSMNKTIREKLGIPMDR